MFDLPAIQTALKQFDLDGWLLYDFRGCNVPARRVVDLAQKPPTSRRWFYFIPREGSPKKLVHRIETAALDHLPGDRHIYLKWQELEDELGQLVRGCRRLAMEYAPRGGNPYILRVDAGTIELVRSLGPEILPSGDLVQLFESAWTDQQWEDHRQATDVTTRAFDLAFGLIAERTRNGGFIGEVEVQQAIVRFFHENGLTTYSPPIVAVNQHSGDPHYEPTPGRDAPIKQGDFVLIDLWAKLDRPGAVYSDLTRVGFVGETVPEPYDDVFSIVAHARDAAISFVRDALSHGRVVRGHEVDDAARAVIDAAGYGPYFIHRTGHSIGEEVHGNGANMDNLETHELRRILPRTCFSIEPGIYLPDFGIRSEVNVYIGPDSSLHVTGGLQSRVLPILADPNASGT